VLFPVVLRADVRKGLGGHGGWIGDLSAYMPIAGKPDKFAVFAGPSLTLADDRYMTRYFGITPVQSARSGYPIHTTDGGAKQVGFGITGVWFITDHWLLNANAAVQHLLGDAANSPIVQTPWGVSAVIAVGYRF
jgi:outer membrane scaffolding protein for murein synthesis (MipA/OmpV family)